MKRIVLSVLPILLLVACAEYEIEHAEKPVRSGFTLRELARIFSELPLDAEHLSEVHEAVTASSGNGYDEEYMMRDLLSSPGAGVGDGPARATVKSYSKPLRDLLEDYFASKSFTRSGEAGVQAWFDELTSSGMQIYWPYSEDWNGRDFPVITFNPGYGAETNYGYAVGFDESGARVVDSVYVDEELARHRPVWVINSNTDAGFTPADFILRKGSGVPATRSASGRKVLRIKSFRMLRNYDTWFAGASEFFIKCGSVDGFSASTDAELRLYSPSVTDFLLVVRRKEKDIEKALDAILLTDFTDQIDKLAFMVTEDDGGARTSWKCSAIVKVQSKSYGFDVDLPYNDKDDIVWRGQLDAGYIRGADTVTGRFGDVLLTFELR